MTGTPSLDDGVPPAVRDLVAAARAGDLAGMAAAVDVQAVGVPRLLRALQQVDRPDRDGVARCGLDELASSPTASDAVRPALNDLARVLATATRIRRTDPAEAADAVQRVTPPDQPPDGLSPDVERRLRGLRARGVTPSEVYVAESPPDRGSISPSCPTQG
jgi:hypothetical protein